jgi:hypothetical protein
MGANSMIITRNTDAPNNEKRNCLFLNISPLDDKAESNWTCLFFNIITEMNFPATKTATAIIKNVAK